MTLIKTDKALAELSSRQRTLNLKERALLLLADGRTPTATLMEQVRTTDDVLAKLISAGYLAPATSVHTPVSTQASVPLVSAKAYNMPTPTGEETAQPTPVAADRFDGQRSLATARMYLFDISERMFARRTPELAQAFRHDLREARDEATMLAVAHRLLHTIEQTAGSERAEAIAERLTKLLPDHATSVN